VIRDVDGNTSCNLERKSDGAYFPLHLNGSTGYVFEVYLGEEKMPKYKPREWYSTGGQSPEVHELTLREYPGIKFTGSDETVTDGTAELFSGMPIWNVYLADLTNDGKPEFCATLSLGSGISSVRVVVRDQSTGKAYTLQDSMLAYDYRLSLQDGKLMAAQYEHGGDRWLAMSELRLVNGELNSFGVMPDIPAPSLKIGEMEPEACYADPADWRGLPASDYVQIGEDEDAAADRLGFRSLRDLAEYADAWALIPSVSEVSAEGDNMQTSIAWHAETIGGEITERQWDGYTVSTGSRILIRQALIGGCTMDEPNNLLRVGGVYLIPVKFNDYWGAYEAVGDLDVLFEIDDNGKIKSHSRYGGLRQYDGRTLPELLEDVRALYLPA
jgi:hypothetical protein